MKNHSFFTSSSNTIHTYHHHLTIRNPNFRLPPEGAKGLQPDGRATATWFCGAVQLLLASATFPPYPSLILKPLTHLPAQLTSPSPLGPVCGASLVAPFIYSCSTDHRIRASAFALNFVVSAAATIWVRCQDKLSIFAQSVTVTTDNTMAKPLLLDLWHADIEGQNGVTRGSGSRGY